MTTLKPEGTEPYLSAAIELLDYWGVTVCKWRKASTGVAYLGEGPRQIECPKPTGPVSFAILAHEVGHHALHGRGVETPLPRGVTRRARWVQELEAWSFALDAMSQYDLPGFEKAESDAMAGMTYAFAKAVRRMRSYDAIHDFCFEAKQACDRLGYPYLYDGEKMDSHVEARRTRLIHT